MQLLQIFLLGANSLHIRAAVGARPFVMLCSTAYTIIVDGPLAKHRSPSKERSTAHPHFPHLALANKVVHADKDGDHCDEANWEWEQYGKRKANP
jgi:hypothetical protein